MALSFYEWRIAWLKWCSASFFFLNVSLLEVPDDARPLDERWWLSLFQLEPKKLQNEKLQFLIHSGQATLRGRTKRIIIGT